MDVAGDMEEVWFVLDEGSLVLCLKKVPNAMMTFVNIHCKCRHEAAHEFGHTIYGVLFKKKVKMVGHEAVGQEVHLFFKVGKWSRPDNLHEVGEWMLFI